MINNTEHLAVLQSPARRIKARVEHYKGSTLYKTYSYTDAIKSIDIERAGEQKFFGFGVCQNAKIVLLDKGREIEVVKGDYFKVYFGVNESYITNYPLFYILNSEDITRDEVTNEITLTAWDKVAISASKTIGELEFTFPITLDGYIADIATYLGLEYSNSASKQELFALEYDSALINLSGTESVRSVLDDIAEVTQTIYYVNGETLIFKDMDNTNSVATVGKVDYFTLSSSEVITLANVASVTELGDNITAYSSLEGVTQYLRENAFITLRADGAEILNKIIEYNGGLTYSPVVCEWRGNYLLEIGDLVAIENKDGLLIYAPIVNDKAHYAGGFNSSLEWSYGGEEETASNPATLGDMLNQTFARVDKAAKKAEIVVSEVEANKQSITSLELTTGGISANVAELDAAVNATMTKDDVVIEIKRELAENGINKVVTNTGFTFDDIGLTISKSGTEMETVISEDGMIVKKNGSAVLEADNTGVKAVNLHATTYLTVGTNSRFENYGSDRTGCFWIGG